MRVRIGSAERQAGWIALGLALWVAGASFAENPRSQSADRETPPAAVRASEPRVDSAPPSPPPSVRNDDRGTPQVGDAHRRPDRRGDRRHYGYRYPRHRVNVGWYVGWGWPWGYWGYWDPWWAHRPVVVNVGDEDAGALDLDLSPERAQIYLDGEYLGVADDYDGFPDYLWLRPGVYDLVVYMPGYKTLAQQVTVRRGVVVDIDDRMQPGEAVKPEDLPARSTERRDERLRRDRERETEVRERAEAAERWESRRDEERSLDARGEPARLRVEVSPVDASVYLDGRFLGSGEELARLRSALWVDPGKHKLEVVRPGYEPEVLEFEARAGAQTDLKVVLDKE